MARSSEALGLLAVVLVVVVGGTEARAQDDPAEVVKKAEESARQDPQEREQEKKEEAEDARRAATMTPAGAGAISVVAPGTISVPPGVPGRPPYNCLHWAFCRKDAWSQPIPPGATIAPPITMEQLLQREGFSTTPVDCATATGHVIMLIWHVPDGGAPIPPDALPADLWWVHAMKRVDGKWSSKNGQDGLWTEISDTGSFLDRHYPPPTGMKTVTRCFAKP